MLENIFKLYGFIESQPFVISVLANVCLGLVLILSSLIPRKFISRELRKSRKEPINKFDKLLLLLSGMIFSIVFCIIGSELIVSLFNNPIPSQYISIIILFSSLSVLIRTLNVIPLNVVQNVEIPSHIKIRRLAIGSFLFASTYNALFSYYPNIAVARLWTVFVFLFYCVEAYIERHSLGKYFPLLKTKEYSVGAKLVDLINRKFVFILFLGMFAVPLINHRKDVSVEILLYSNIIGMFSVCGIAFILQMISSAFVNKFINKLENLEAGKSSKKSAQLRRKNLLWICDVLVVSCYLCVINVILWLVGIRVGKYIFHDSIITIGLTIFGTILIFNAFKEFADVFVDKADPVDHEKILTFMPIVSIIFNTALFCISVLIILSELNVSIVPFIAYFAAAATAVSLAAQDIIKSFLQGIILLFEKNFYIGDFITINGVSGTVTKISTRTLTLNSPNGDEISIPYSSVNMIVNHSRDYYIHNEMLLVTPDSNVQRAAELLVQLVSQMRQKEEFSRIICEDVVIHGINTFSEVGVQINWTLKTVSSADGRFIYLEIYKRLRSLFIKEGIRVPYKQEYLLSSEKAG